MARRFAVRHRYLLPLTTLLLSVAVALPGFAQPNQGNAEAGLPVIESYNARAYNGFPQIWTILEDRRGIMYFGNSGGEILEYDGVTWRKITTANVVRSLAIDDDGKIWVGSSANFGYLSPDAAGTLSFVSLLDKVPTEPRNFTDVWQVLITPQGVFFRSYEHLFRWDGKHMQVWSPAAKSRFEALSAVRGRIYTAQSGIGLQEIAGDELRNLPGGDGYRDSIKLFLHPYDAQRILVSARNGLFTLYDGEKVTPFPTAVDDYFLKYKLYTSTILADGSICATTLGGGVVILEHDGKLRQIIDKDAGLLNSETLSAYQDREGALWVGMEDGLSRVEVESPVSILSRLSSYDVLRFHGTIYASGVGSNSAVSRLVSDPKTGRPSFVPLQGPGQGWTLMMFKDPEGKTPDQLLAATSDGAMRVEGDNVVPAMPSVHGLPEQNYFLLQSRKTPARVFIGHSDGIESMRWDGHTWIDEGRLPGTLYEARSLAEDADGTLWAAGADSKVLRVEVAPSGMHDSKFQEPGAREGLPAGITDVEFVAGSTFVTLTRTQHIYRWDAAGHKFVVDDRFLLPVDSNDATPYLFPALNGSFWSQSFSYDNRRLALFSRQPDGSWHAEEDAYRRLERFRTLFPRSDPDGVVLCPGEYVLRFTPGKNTASPQPFPTLVRQVNAGSQVVFGGTSTAGAQPLRLPPGSNALRFQFALLSYANPSGNQYQYQLQGADRDWSAGGTQKEANYSDLGPGSYRFRVRARADDGHPGEEAVYAFTILPPWYRTTLAYVVYALLFLLLALAAWRMISRHEREKARRKTEALEAQAKALEATVNERTQEIRAQAEGGDFFDFFLIDEDRLGVVIGDVSGKGIPAALFMAVTRTQVKTTAQRGMSPAECFHEEPGPGAGTGKRNVRHLFLWPLEFKVG